MIRLNDRSPHTSTESSQEIIYRKMRNKLTTTTPYNSDVMQKQKKLTLGRTRKFIPPTVVQAGGGGGGVNGIHPGVFDMLQYFETILPLVVSLWSS